MQNVTYLAAHDITVNCESGNIEYKKGDMVDLCYSESGEVWIAYAEEQDNKVYNFEIDITDMEVFSKLLENVIVEEVELDDKISYEELSLDQLIIEENTSQDQLLQFMVEANFKRGVRGDKVVKVPVRRIKTKLTPKQKAARMKTGKALSRNPIAKKNKAKSMKIRKRLGLGESYIIDKAKLFNNDIKVVTQDVFETLTVYFGDKAKVKLKEGKVSVNLFNADEEQLIEALDNMDINYHLEGSADYKFVSVYKPQAQVVVESYYAEEEDEPEDSEDDGDDMDMDAMKEKLMKMKEEYDKMDDGDEKDKLKGEIEKLEAACGKKTETSKLENVNLEESKEVTQVPVLPKDLNLRAAMQKFGDIEKTFNMLASDKGIHQTPLNKRSANKFKKELQKLIGDIRAKYARMLR